MSALTKVLSLGGLLIAIGTAGFYEIHGMIDADAPGTKLVNAFYCSVSTLTTIGFGDICPGHSKISSVTLQQER